MFKQNRAFAVFAFALVLFLDLAITVNGSQSKSTATSSQEGQGEVEVKISPLRNTITSGETVQLRVEIWNVGTKDVFVCRNFQTNAPPCGLRFILEDSAKRKYSSGGLSSGDCFITGEKGNFADALTKSWIMLPPQHFYGAIAAIDTSGFTEIPKPGHYNVQGHFAEGDMLGRNCGGLQPWAAEVSQLPAKAWQGQIDTNSVVINVISTKTR